MVTCLGTGIETVGGWVGTLTTVAFFLEDLVARVIVIAWRARETGGAGEWLR